ncbi:MAG: hypothetical protein V4628_12675, partial [Pseudomonadota bacterium]
MRFFTRHPILLTFLAGIAVLVFVSFNKAQHQSAATANNFAQRGQSAATPVVVETIGRQMLADQVESVGTTGANESIDITAKVAETLNKIHFEDGAFVQKGDLLVELTNSAEASR